jgi:hypothetical protein
VSALGDRDAHFHEYYQRQVDDYNAVNPRPPLSHSASSSSQQSYHDVTPFPAAPSDIFPDLEEGSTVWGEQGNHLGQGWNLHRPGITKTALRVPHPHGSKTDAANYHRYTFNGYGEPILEGTMGAGEPVWGEPLVAMEETTPRQLTSQAPPFNLLEAENYFHSGVVTASPLAVV